MNYDFVEIGTSNFDTLIQKADDNTIGLSVEPVLYYLNQLPSKRFVKKINCAISFDLKDHDVDVYYVPEQFISQFKLPDWLAGCNSIDDYHPQHRKLQIEHLVIKEKVRSIPLQKLFDINQIEKLKLLKLDTEGGDCDILLNFHSFLKSSKQENLPEKIIFETNTLTPILKIEIVIDKYTQLGYKVESSVYGDNTVLVI